MKLFFRKDVVHEVELRNGEGSVQGKAVHG